MQPPELKRWLDDCEREARAKGLSSEDICIVFMDKTREIMVVHRNEKVVQRENQLSMGLENLKVP